MTKSRNGEKQRLLNNYFILGWDTRGSMLTNYYKN